MSSQVRLKQCFFVQLAITIFPIWWRHLLDMLRVRHLFPPNADWTLRDVLIDRRRRLGSGAFGEVFAADWKGCRVAAKKIHDVFFDRNVVSEEQCARILSEFARECALQAKMRHPHIVQLYGVQLPAEDARGAPVVMISELMAETLRARVLRAPRLTLRDVIDMSLQIASALLFLHERDEPIAHRDLSANNVMLTSSGVCKVGDVGLAKIFTDARRVGMTMKPGTEPYMPGEVLSIRSRYNEKLDVFSLGVLMLEMSVGHEPRPTPEFLTEEEVGGRTMLAPIPEVRRRQKELDELGREHPLRPLIERIFQSQVSRPNIGVVYEELERLRTQPAYATSPSTLGNAETVAARLAGDVREVRTEMDNLNRQQNGLGERLERLEEKVREDMQSLRHDLVGELRLSLQQIGGEMRQWLESASQDIQRKQHVNLNKLRGDMNRVAASQEQLQRDVRELQRDFRGIAASQLQLEREVTCSHELLQAISSVQPSSQQLTVVSPSTASVGQRPAVCKVPLALRQWWQLPCMPGKKVYCQAARLENWVVVLGGLSQMYPSVRLCRRVFAFDTLSGVWEEWPPMPYACCAAGSDGKQLFIAGGCLEEGGDAVSYVFRLTSERKTQWEALTNMPEAMCIGSAAIQHDHLYILGGCKKYSGKEIKTKRSGSLVFQVLNIKTGVWSTDDHCLTTSVDGRLLIEMCFYSLVSLHDSLITDKLVCYDTEKKNSTDLPTRPGFFEADTHSGLTVVGSQLLACGGFAGYGGETDKVHVLNENRTTWHELAPMITTRRVSSACNVNGVVYVVGGSNAGWNVLDKVESFH